MCWPASTGQERATARRDAINGRLERLRGSALGFRNLTHYIARACSRPAASGRTCTLGCEEPDSSGASVDDGVVEQGGLRAVLAEFLPDHRVRQPLRVALARQEPEQPPQRRLLVDVAQRPEALADQFPGHLLLGLAVDLFRRLRGDLAVDALAPQLG